MMKKTMTGVAVALMMVGCNSSTNNEAPFVVCPPTGLELTRGEQELVSSNNDFAFNLFRQVAKADESQIISPISITYALGMLNNGAAGQTQQQINQVLGFTDADAVNSFCQKMLVLAPQLDTQTKLLIANNIYVNKDYVLYPEFVKKANDYYFAQPETRDFHDGKTMDVINQWASDHTEQMIDKVLDEKSFSPDAASYLLNAIYFKGEWSSKFDKQNTQQEPFGDTDQQVPMMRQEGSFLYTANEDCQALQLPYGSGLYTMTVLLPNEGKAVSDILQGMTAEGWKQLNAKMADVTVDVKLPRFETKADIDLKDVMANLGMPDAFSPAKADFSNFCSKPTYIDLMKQVARIKVNEEGSEAAAVTIIGMENSVGPAHYTFFATRPFLYVISEQSTGAIFFVGQYTGR